MQPSRPSNNNAPAQSPEAEQQREHQIKRLVEDYERQLRQSLPQGTPTLDEIEQAVEEIGEQVKKTLHQEVLDALGSGYVGKTVCCPGQGCGKPARYVSEYPRQLVTLHGVQRLGRAYYYCACCGRGFCPLDGALGLPSGQCSLRVRALACRFASFLPFATAARELEGICGVRLSASTIRREAHKVGQQLRRDWAKTQRQVLEATPDQALALQPKRCAERLHLSLDGVMVHAGGEWREAKVGVTYQSQAAGGVTNARYCATLCSSGEFGRRALALCFVSGAPSGKRLAVVADGGPWIWQEVGKYFPHSTQILDFYHAGTHLWAVAEQRFGANRQAARDWMSQQAEHLLEDKVAEVLSELEGWQARGEHQERLQRTTLAYFREHSGRMCYGTLRAAGWHIGSGVVESACKSVVQQRMKGAGMRWSESGAEALLHLRADWCSTGHTDFLPAVQRAAYS
jgi:hypothetical protein